MSLFLQLFSASCLPFLRQLAILPRNLLTDVLELLKGGAEVRLLVNFKSPLIKGLLCCLDACCTMLLLNPDAQLPFYGS